MSKKTHEQFVAEIEQINPKIKIVGKYTGAKSYVDVECKICGFLWETQASNLVSGKGCPVCGNRQKYTHSSFVDKMKSINSNVEIISHFEGRDKPITCRCMMCGHVWTQTAVYVLRGKGCPKCRKEKNKEMTTRSHDDFVKRMSNLNPNIDFLEKYSGNHTNISCVCKICSHVWSAKPSNLMRGTGCPHCNKRATSFMEKFIYETFVELYGSKEVLARDKNAIGKELDIYIPKLRIAVEPGCWYFHKRRIDHDKEKKKLCNQCGIKLFIIYTEYDAEIQPFEDCYITSLKIDASRNYDVLQDIVGSIIEKSDESIDLNGIDWNDIRIRAIKSAGRKTTQDFRDEMSKISPNIEVVGEYVNSVGKIECKCLRCGYIWSASASNLLQGYGCAICANNKKKTSEKFKSEVHGKSGSVRVIGEYNGNKLKIKCECKKCGYVWDANPSVLLRGGGCPKCGRSQNMKTTEQFSKELAEITDDLYLVSEYVDSSTKVRVYCRKCGNEWECIPYRLIKKRVECPFCKKENYKSTRRKSHSTYTSEVAQVNPSLNILSEYRTCNDTISFQCSKCGYKNSVKANRLLHEYRCPQCVENDQVYEKHNVFLEKMKHVNDQIKIMGEYKSAKHKIECLCLVCNNTWYAAPTNLLSGTGCPVCSAKRISEKKKKRIYQLTKMGDTVCVYNSLTEAAMAVGVDPARISMSIKSKNGMCAGYVWKYANDTL